MAMTVFNPEEIRKAISIINPKGELFEVRLLETKGKKNASGYFKDAETLIDALTRVDNLERYNIYVTLNCIKDSCYSRDQRNEFIINAKTQTSDNDIEGYNYLFVDIDPNRPSGVSSTDEQLAHAKNTGNKVFKFLRQVGFEKPITAMSGNGVHLLYKISLKNSNENKNLIQDCLKALDMLFTDEYVSIDRTNFNPARICKLYGTLAHKGSNTTENPHRMSHVIDKITPTGVTNRSYLEKLVDMLPKKEEPKKYNNYAPSEFDLDAWLDKYGIRYQKTAYSDGQKYIMQECPFDSNHNGKDAAVFKMSNGAIGFRCLHNSCADRGWKDVRILYEPDAYERRNQQFDKIAYHSHNKNASQGKIEPLRKEEGKPLFFTADAILSMPRKEETFVRTGIKGVDEKIRGLKKSYVSLWSGLRGSAKSTILSQTILTALNDGCNVGCYSGELNPTNFMRWMFLQAAGKGRVEPGRYEGYYSVPLPIQKQIAQWMGDCFWLYNNDYGNRFEQILEEFEKKIVENKLDLLVLDNLMSFNISALAESKWEAQTVFVWKLHELANKYNCHIAFVAHPRKALGFLRLDDIAGTADLANAVEYAFIVHRNNNDFKRLSGQMFGWREDNYVYAGTNVVEVSKDRDGGTQDLFVPLYYEVETKRLKNSQTENIIYGWDDDFVPVIDGDEPEFD